MKLTNYSTIKKDYYEKKEPNSEIKTVAEYVYIKKEESGKIKEKRFVSTVVSTIDVPYGRYVLK